MQLHIFCDASPSSYGCVVSLRHWSKHSDTKVSFVYAKAKVCPMKAWSIHRYALLGGLLAARIGNKLISLLDVSVDSTYFWSDNASVLSWVKSDPSRWKPFIANRIRLIQELSNGAKWQYVRSKNNPADICSLKRELSYGNRRSLPEIGGINFWYLDNLDHDVDPNPTLTGEHIHGITDRVLGERRTLQFRH